MLAPEVAVLNEGVEDRVYFVRGFEAPPGEVEDFTPRKSGRWRPTVPTVRTWHHLGDLPPDVAGQLGSGVGAHHAKGGQGVRQEVLPPQGHGRPNGRLA